MKHLLLSIAVALGLWSCHGGPTAGLSIYHEALALAEQGDAPAALTKLEQAAQRATTDSLRALAHSQMGTLFFAQRLLDRALQSYQTAYAIDLRARDTVGLIYDLRDIGNVLRATDEGQDSCIACFTEARRLAQLAGHTALQRDVESQMAAYHLYHNHLDEARQLLMPALSAMDSTNQSALIFMLADLYQREGRADSAAICYEQLLTCGTIFARQAAHRALAEQALARGDNALAAQHLRQYEVLTDSVHKQNDAEGLRHVAALYDYTLREQQAHRLNVRLTMAVAATLVALLLLAATILYYSRRRMHYRLKVARLEALLAEHRHAAASDGPPAAEGLTATPIFQHISRQLGSLNPSPLTDEAWQQLEDAIETAYPHYVKRLLEFCRLTPQERRVCLLLKLGIAPTGIAQLTAHSKQSITNTRSRLYEKAFGRKGTPAQWDQFLQTL